MANWSQEMVPQYQFVPYQTVPYCLIGYYQNNNVQIINNRLKEMKKKNLTVCVALTVSILSP